MKTNYDWNTDKPDDVRLTIEDPASGVDYHVSRPDLPRKYSLRAVAKAFTVDYYNPDDEPVVSKIIDEKSGEKVYFKHSGGNGKFLWDISCPENFNT